MMTNLFSVFDPSSSMMLFYNWNSSIIFILMISPLFWTIPSRNNMLFNKLTNFINSEFKTLLGPSSFKGSTLMFISLFLFIILNNVMGLFPYIFTSTSHLIMTLSLSLPMWLMLMLVGWINHSKYMFAHLVPQSTPIVLMPFMVVIETISNIIRPGTLAVRLMANMTAGHLLMTLLGNQTALANNFILASLLIVQIMLLTLESAVAIIQSYVFSVLSTLYTSEITTH
uniref:ATP synthase F0 subunit 6 n=1 Tax=Tomocerus caputiviolaceus TaxID=2763923 RepID=UPI0021D53B78|nr:ATP synthase F0 subunit 6 [Tomocerus caputiviolaceus]UXC95409.1 ATP synthase F0 subunit 6 [Tomocerus caputiviolaceus]